MVFKSDEVYGRLATVAIAGLVRGPIGLTGAALTEAVSAAKDYTKATAPARELHKAVADAVKAQGPDVSDRIPEESIALGITLATDTVALYAATIDDFARLDFDPNRITQEVINAAWSADMHWRLHDEPHFGVAENAITVTYRVLAKQLSGKQEVVIPAIKSMYERIATLGNSVDEVREAVSQRASRQELRDYLHGRIKDWDWTVWERYMQSSPSILERSLRVRPDRTNPSSGSGPAYTAWDALDGQRILVVLGRPGAGKSWLAQRYAREAAVTALAALDSGTVIEDVELPVMTTWDRWIKSTATETGRALVDASFASGQGHRDLGTAVMARLRRTLTTPGQKVLAVIDSLDEASGSSQQGGRLNELERMAGWRTVITSRDAAWHAIHQQGWGDDIDDVRVVHLESLSYPKDVEEFIDVWFIDDPARGMGLKGQIRRRPDLQQIAIIPLILTFYCLISATGTHTSDPTGPLPRLRHDLYNELICGLLSSGWKLDNPGGSIPPGSVLSCVEALKAWAWHAVENANTPVGLGDWEETFLQAVGQDDVKLQALGHVAQVVEEDWKGRVTRKFIHRTVLEYLVAEHVSDLDVGTAAQALLPHLWFDSDWQIAAPAAIAGHNRREQGVLLQYFLDQSAQHASDPARQIADDEFDDLLLGIAADSNPDEWSETHQALIHQCRIRNTLRNLEGVTRSTHWSVSNQDVRTVILEALPGAKRWNIGGLVMALSQLELTDSESRQTWAMVVKWLPASSPAATIELVRLLATLNLTDVERAKTFCAAFRQLSPFDSRATADLAEAMVALMATADDHAKTLAAILEGLPVTNELALERALGSLTDLLPAMMMNVDDYAQARAVVLNRMATASLKAAIDLVRVLSALAPTANDREVALEVILKGIPTIRPWQTQSVVEVLSKVAATDAGRERALDVLLQIAATANRPILSYIAPIFPKMVITTDERTRAREVVLNALSVTNANYVGGLIGVLSDLDPTHRDYASVLNLVLTTDPDVARRLVDALPLLVTTEDDRAWTRVSVVRILSTSEPALLCSLLGLLSDLDPGSDDREMALTMVLKALPNSGPDIVHSLTDALVGLLNTARDRVRARACILEVLSSARRSDVGRLVRALDTMNPTEEDRVKALNLVLKALLADDSELVRDLAVRREARRITSIKRPGTYHRTLTSLSPTELSIVSDLIRELLRLVVTEDERARARAAVLEALSNAKPAEISDLVGSLTTLEPTDRERARARMVLLEALRYAKPAEISDLVGSLTTLEPTDRERARARMVLLEALRFARPSDVCGLVAGLTAIGLTADDRVRALAAVLRSLPTSKPDPDVVRSLTDVLPGILVTADDVTRARGGIFEALLSAKPGCGDDLVGMLLILETSDAGRERTLAELLEALPTTSPEGGRSMAQVLPGLAITDAERRRALNVVLDALLTASPGLVRVLVQVVPKLATTAAGREVALNKTLKAMPIAQPWVVGSLINVLPFLATTDGARSLIVDTIFDTLPAVSPELARALVGVLPGLATNDAGRERVETRIVEKVPTAAAGTVHSLVRTLRSVSPVKSWLEWLWR